MKAHGANVGRIGEFSWSRMEPTEGAYDMGWLVRAVRLAAKYDIKVVIGTPTDTPPAWMTQKYPEVLRIDGDGKRLGHGGRRQFSISSTLRSEEHTSELQSLMRISYAVFCLKKKKKTNTKQQSQ